MSLRPAIPRRFALQHGPPPLRRMVFIFRNRKLSVNPFPSEGYQNWTRRPGQGKLSTSGWGQIRVSRWGQTGISNSAVAQSDEAMAQVRTANARIAEAERDPAAARAQVAGATAEAARANLELAKLRTPRSITDVPGLASALKKFKGTEYTFSSVFQDPEAVGLLAAIDSLLRSAEWTKVKPLAGFPAVNVYGKDDGNAVTVGFGIGVLIQFNSPDSATMPSVPIEKLPPTAMAAVTLQRGLLANLSPKATDEDVPKANVEPGDSRTTRITVGRKP
jgi:outer membrane murein-binding lipoprotein Lpp